MKLGGQIHASAALTLEINSFSLKWKLGGSRKASGQFGEEKNALPLTEFKHQPVQPKD